MPITGQCKTNPVSGVAGDIYNALVADSDNGLASSATTSGSTARKLLGALIESIAAAIVAGASGAHAEGAAVSWTSGSTAGKIELGAAAPNGSFTSGAGCDEGGLFTFAAGANTTTGTIFTVHFATNFTNAPAVEYYPGNANAADLFFNNKLYATSTTSAASLVMPATAGLGNLTYAIYWHAKGSK